MSRREKLAWTISLILVTGTLLGSGNPAASVQNGDVNGDGVIDIADVVYLANYLFTSGPPPAETRFELLPSGQTLCYDGVGNTIPCDDPQFPGQDGHYQLGTGNLAERYQLNGDGTVTDLTTGLQWLQSPLSAEDWQGALLVCEGLSFAGHQDWRLPNHIELVTLYRPEMFYSVSPTGDYEWFGIFDNGPGTLNESFTHWSSTTRAIDSERAWTARLPEGGIFTEPKSASHLVRAVRGPD